ncbi:type III secretion system inner membrane ring lipoprotein SctJ [Piscinibacter sp.]|uniref:type III secretion system inner membrane ring lipoprotein SctJ n=1 Tax=Piscinibacter sp. TaxID=1903157 RepID=UPI002C095DA2|nr:type III secretion inner membrane ring lipoprotein SctJ [Albitalea sp.]HUG22601.1 type III secretion inner membrane ring lipoprotein SctJ [Albitalea sp.]
MNARAHVLLAASFAVLLAGCGEQDLYTDLSQRQANEMVAVLRNAGIEADKQLRDGNTFAVTAPASDFSHAVEVLRATGYPREGFDTLGQVFKKEGFVSSPLEERARLTHALSQEISNTLASIDGVVMARVHLSVPERDPLADKPPPASASVFIKHRAGVNLESRMGHIKALVVNSIQGLPYDNVTVVLFPTEAWPVRSAPADDGLRGFNTTLWSIAGAGALALAAGGGLWWWHRRRPAVRPPGATPLCPVEDLPRRANG